MLLHPQRFHIKDNFQVKLEDIHKILFRNSTNYFLINSSFFFFWKELLVKFVLLKEKKKQNEQVDSVIVIPYFRIVFIAKLFKHLPFSTKWDCTFVQVSMLSRHHLWSLIKRKENEIQLGCHIITQLMKMIYQVTLCEKKKILKVTQIFSCFVWKAKTVRVSFWVSSSISETNRYKQ